MCQCIQQAAPYNPRTTIELWRVAAKSVAGSKVKTAGETHCFCQLHGCAAGRERSEGPRDVPPGEDGEENLTCSLGGWFICTGRERESLPSARVCSAKGSRVHVVTKELSAREGRGQPPRPDGGHVFRLSVFMETSNLLYPQKIILYVKAAQSYASSPFCFQSKLAAVSRRNPEVELLQSLINLPRSSVTCQMFDKSHHNIRLLLFTDTKYSTTQRVLSQ